MHGALIRVKGAVCATAERRPQTPSVTRKLGSVHVCLDQMAYVANIANMVFGIMDLKGVKVSKTK